MCFTESQREIVTKKENNEWNAKYHVIKLFLFVKKEDKNYKEINEQVYGRHSRPKTNTE